MFWVAFGVLCFTAVIYCIWASGEVQPFNNAPIQPRSVDFEAQERKVGGEKTSGLEQSS